MSDLPEFIIDREFKAPRDIVWKAWTDPALLSQWYGPAQWKPSFTSLT